MAVELPSVLLLFKTRLINLFSEKYLLIKILKPWPQETWRFVNQNLTLQANIFQKRANLCLALPQKFKKTFAYENK